jgi:hypothetical protein
MEKKALFTNVRGRGSIDYMLRTTQQHHVQLSTMADQKANILVGVAFLVFTLSLNYFKRGGQFPISLGVLCFFALMAAFFAILAVMPSIRKQRQKPDPDSPAFNLLFFSFFTQLTLEEYWQQMEKVLESDAKVYQTILKDIYQLGSVLYRKKYRYLGYSYRIFIIGLIATFVVAIVEYSR